MTGRLVSVPPIPSAGRAHRLSVPVWARLNWLAHCPPEDMVALVRGERGLVRPHGTWAWAVPTLAEAMVTDARGRPP